MHVLFVSEDPSEATLYSDVGLLEQGLDCSMPGLYLGEAELRSGGARSRDHLFSDGGAAGEGC